MILREALLDGEWGEKMPLSLALEGMELSCMCRLTRAIVLARCAQAEVLIYGNYERRHGEGNFYQDSHAPFLRGLHLKNPRLKSLESGC